MIPNIRRHEWKDLLSGTINPKLNSLSLKLKLNNLRMGVRTKKMTVDEAVQEIHSYCASNTKMYSKDLKTIFQH